MRKGTAFLTAAALGLWLACIAPAQAHVVVTPNPASLQGGITYEFEVDVEHTGSTGTWGEPLQ